MELQQCHDALDIVDTVIMTCPVNYVVDMDIAKFFDLYFIPLPKKTKIYHFYAISKQK